MKKESRCRVAAIALAVAVAALTFVLLAPKLFGWSQMCCMYQDVDIETGRVRRSWYLFYCKVSGRIEDSSLMEALGEEQVKGRKGDWRRVSTYSPGVRHSPHYMWHAAINQTKMLVMVWEIEGFSGEQRRKAAQRVVEIWHGPNPAENADAYINGLLQEGRKEKVSLIFTEWAGENGLELKIGIDPNVVAAGVREVKNIPFIVTLKNVGDEAVGIAQVPYFASGFTITESTGKLAPFRLERLIDTAPSQPDCYAKLEPGASYEGHIDVSVGSFEGKRIRFPVDSGVFYLCEGEYEVSYRFSQSEIGGFYIGGNWMPFEAVVGAKQWIGELESKGISLTVQSDGKLSAWYFGNREEATEAGR